MTIVRTVNTHPSNIERAVVDMNESDAFRLDHVDDCWQQLFDVSMSRPIRAHGRVADKTNVIGALLVLVFVELFNRCCFYPSCVEHVNDKHISQSILSAGNRARCRVTCPSFLQTSLSCSTLHATRQSDRQVRQMLSFT
jgi:hypothetical protein